MFDGEHTIVNFYVGAYNAGGSYEENVMITYKLYEKIINLILGIKLKIPELNEDAYIESQFFSDSDITKYWSHEDTVRNDGKYFYEKLLAICTEHNIDLLADIEKARNHVDTILPRKDYYLIERNCYKRLEDEFKKYGKLIFCVDFDDTLYDFHKAGRTYDDIMNLLRRWEKYSEVIIFTGNGEDKYPMIEEYLAKHKIKYKGINCDSSIAVDGRKTYANVYIDDRGGLPLVYKHLITLIEKIESGVVKYGI